MEMIDNSVEVDKSEQQRHQSIVQEEDEKGKEDDRKTINQLEKPPSISVIEDEANDDAELTDCDTLASQLYEGKSTFVAHNQIASWLGDGDNDRGQLRSAYMALFDWTDKSVLSAVRSLCDRLYLKAESQQLDRLIDSFSDRWHECNPMHGFKSMGVVYTLAYSILLLNTDHHSEEYSSNKKMSRSQYVQQTLNTIRNLVKAEDITFSKVTTSRDSKADLSSYYDLESISSKRNGSLDTLYYRPNSSKKRRNAIRGENTTLVCDTTNYCVKEWESLIESLLKGIYASVDLTPLNLAKGDIDDDQMSVSSHRNSLSFFNRLHPQSSLNSLNHYSSNRSVTNTSSSIMSKFTLNRRSSWMAGSDNWSEYNYQEAVSNNNTNNNNNKHILSKRRSMYADTSGLSDNIGFAGALRNTMIKEEYGGAAISSVASRISNGNGSTTTTRSGQNNNNTKINNNNNQSQIPTDLSGSDLTKSSTSMVNSEVCSIATSAEESMITGDNGLTEEEKQSAELALHGAPWAKEGLLKFQAYLDNGSITSKKYKKKDWVQVFVVVQNGYLKMFRFDQPNHHHHNHHSPVSRRSRNHLNTAYSSTQSLLSQPSLPSVGGGNWLDNATMTDNISLCHTMAQVSPMQQETDSYISKRSSIILSSAYVNHDNDSTHWSLTLPNQGVLIFQAGTREIADEYVYACNYWAAGISKEPLVEAVSSIEYGWDKPIEIFDKQEQYEKSLTISSGSFDILYINQQKIQVKEWRPPVASTIHSTYDEEKQLQCLQSYIEKVENGLENHNSLRAKMIRIFQSNYLVSTRAHTNWEKRSQYLLKETIKYGVYVSTLEKAISDKTKVLNQQQNGDVSIEVREGSRDISEEQTVIEVKKIDEKDVLRVEVTTQELQQVN